MAVVTIVLLMRSKGQIEPVHMHWLDADYALLQAVLCVMTPRSSAMRARYSRIA
ncbi:hypothetical protein PQQ84_24705 [Paraburkholderia strydomiana]|jgi:hypothetical protein|uniref:hypothetical protein n=1 Tax=Paraburkholderia strydomiana TaxID=1245417 RepID=UPI0038B8F19A